MKNLIKETVENIILSGDFISPEGMSYEDFEQKINEIVTRVTKQHYQIDEEYPEDSGIEDWDMWEQDIRIALAEEFED